MEELLRESDIVTVHAKSNQETRGLIGDKELGLMKPGAFLINTARGPIVSEAALVRALERGQLGGVGLDVFDEEPLPFEHPLRRFDNAILLPRQRLRHPGSLAGALRTGDEQHCRIYGRKARETFKSGSAV